ncbi:hypothetical protein ACFL1X_01525 [Candidatus Hydrogenedentota bacterium]
MSNDRFFFIPMLDRALREEHQSRALKKTFEQIEIMGREPRYSEGAEQFRLFLETTCQFIEFNPIDENSEELVWAILLEMVTQALEHSESMPAVIRAFGDIFPEWKENSEQLEIEIVELNKPVIMQLLLERNNNIVGTVEISDLSGSGVFKGITPGFYRAILNGRVVWEANLTESDLVWTAAFPGRDLELAAATDKGETAPIPSVDLLNGEIVINVFHGTENGSLEIKVDAGNSNGKTS